MDKTVTEIVHGLEAEKFNLLRFIKALEWLGDEAVLLCPICNNPPRFGHSQACRMANVLNTYGLLDDSDRWTEKGGPR
jgi:hypothetical protein